MPEKRIERNNLTKLPIEVLKNMIDMLLTGIVFKTQKERDDFLKSKGYYSDHSKWTKSKMISFIMKFNPKLSNPE